MRIHQFRSTRRMRDKAAMPHYGNFQCIFCGEISNESTWHLKNLPVRFAFCPLGMRLGLLQELWTRLFRREVNCLIDFRHYVRRVEPTVQGEDREREDEDDED